VIETKTILGIILGISLFMVTTVTIASPSFSQEQTSVMQQNVTDSSLSKKVEGANNNNSTVQITRSSTSSYNIVNDQTGLVGTFDNKYTIVGSSSSLNKSKDLIISLIHSDLDGSPTIGYVRAKNVTDGLSRGATPTATLPNPFVDQQTINSTITQKISNAIDSARTLNFTTVAIKCDFDMNIIDWNCETHGVLR
jgi:hypothetical protein